jgi:acetylornithine/succinyldiaminopimelate/putrescine aminotransferase
MCTTEKVAAAFARGSHGSTFGGNPVACAAAVAALGVLADPALHAHVREIGAYLRRRLEELAARHRAITQVRGEGLMLAAVLDRPGAPVVERCLADGLLINCTADRVLRFLPPLVIERPLVDDGLAILEKALAAA